MYTTELHQNTLKGYTLVLTGYLIALEWLVDHSWQLMCLIWNAKEVLKVGINKIQCIQYQINLIKLRRALNTTQRRFTMSKHLLLEYFKKLCWYNGVMLKQAIIWWSTKQQF